MDTITLAMSKAFTRRAIKDIEVPESMGNIPIAYTLPTDAKEGELIWYTPQGNITLSDSEGRVGLNWDELRKPYVSNNEEYPGLDYSCFSYFESDGISREFKLRFNRDDKKCRIVYIISRQNGISGLFYEETFRIEIDYMIGNLRKSFHRIVTEDTENETEYNTFEELPVYFQLPEFDTLVVEEVPKNKGYLFHKEYQLMRYQLGEWVEVVSDNGIPVVHILPTNAKDGDLCFYAPQKIITLEDSGKKIYFDWNELREKYISGDDNNPEVQYGFGSNFNDGVIEGNFGFQSNRSDTYYGMHYEFYNYNADTGEMYQVSLTVCIDYITGNLIDSDSYYYCTQVDINGETTEESKQYTTFEELPTCIKLPKFDTFDEYRSENIGYLFHGEYQLMKYQGNEWVEVVKVPTKTSELENDSGFVTEGGVPAVHTLPTDAKDGDMCLYAPQNIFTLADSGKRIYFDWEEFAKPVGEDETSLPISCNFDGNIVLEANISHSLYESALWIQKINPELSISENLSVSFVEGVLDTEVSEFRVTNHVSGEKTTTHFNSIDDLPLYFDIPEFDYIVPENELIGNEYLFHTKYQLMKYQGGEWIEAVDVPTKTSQFENDSGFLTEESVSTVYFLPEKGESGDLCLYGIPNTVTKEDSGKYIYFDWKEIEKTEPDKANYSNIIVFKGRGIDSIGETRVEIECGIYHGDLIFEFKLLYENIVIEDYRIWFDLSSKDLVHYQDRSRYYKYSPEGEVIEYIQYTKDTLPTCIKLPEFSDFIVEEKNSEIDIPFFFTNKYKLMVHQGGEWVEVCASESGVSDEQIKKAVDEYLAENPVSGITVTDDGNGNVTIA